MTAFGTTGRDSFKRPQGGSSLDPAYITAAQEALVTLESKRQNAVTVEAGSARSASLCVPIQRWLVSYNGTPIYGGRTTSPNILLSLSPAILEDAGITPPQTTNPLVSLASSRSLDTAARLPVDLAGVDGLTLTKPSWVLRLQQTPIVRFSARLVGATGNQVIATGNPQFFDAGSGISPRVLLPISYGSPDLETTALPAGNYEICLLIIAWG